MGSELTNYFYGLDDAVGTGLVARFPECTATPADNPYTGFRLLFPKSDGWHQKDAAGLDSGLVSIPTPGGTANRVAYFSGAYALTSDADLTFDGTTLTIPQDSRIKMGTGSGTAKVKGMASVNTTPVGNIGGGEDTLQTYSLPANSLSTNGNTVHVLAHGRAVASTNITLKFKFGTASETLVNAFNFTATTTWKADIYITRVASNSQTIRIEFHASDIVAALTGNEYTRIITMSATETDSGAITINFTGESSGAVNDDIIQNFMLVEFYNN